MTQKFFEQLATFITAAFSLVAALAWNSAITDLIQRYIKPGNNTLSLFLYAVIITLIAVLVTIQVGKISQRIHDNLNKKPRPQR